MGRLIPPVAKEKVLQWFPMAEGSGDVVGYAGGTRKGPTWVEDDKWMGGYALDGDGVDDYVETTNWGEMIDKIIDSEISVAFTVEAEDDSDESQFMGGVEDDGTRFAVFHNRDYFDINQSIAVEIEDQDSNQIIHKAPDDVLDGGVHRAVTTIEGIEDGDVSFFIDGTEVDSIVERNQNPNEDNMSNLDRPVSLFARRDSDENARFYEGILDDVIIYGDSLTESEIQQDYLRQHWS